MYIGCFCVFYCELPYLDDHNQHQPQHGVIMVKLSTSPEMGRLAIPGWKLMLTCADVSRNWDIPIEFRWISEIFRKPMRLGLAVTCLVHWQKRGSGPSGPCISEAAKLCSRHKHIFFGRKTLIPCLQVPSCPIIHPVTGFVLLASAAAFRALQVAEKSPELQLMDRHFSIF